MANIDLQFTEEIMNSFPNPADYLSSVANTFVTNVKTMAQDNLSTARQDYIDAVTQHPMQVEGDKLSVTIELVGAFPNMLEQGHDPYDMKESLLKGRDYRSIFIRKGTPASTRFQKMTKEQHMIMKHLKTTSDKAAFPPFLTKGNQNVTAYGVHHTATKERAKPHHESPIYGKMQKIVRGTSPTYGTFRTVSVKSPPESWQHPGFEALDFFDKVAERMGL